MRQLPSVIAVSIAIASLAGCATQGLNFASGLQSVPSISAFVMNGLSVQPVSAFPAQAFAGMPAVRSLADMSALASGAKLFALAGHAAVSDGNMETAMLNWYVAQNLASRSMAITQGSIKAIGNIDKNGDTTVGPRSLIMLPVSGLGNSNALASLLEQKEFADYAQFDWANSPKLAGGTIDVLGQALNGLSGNTSQNQPQRYASTVQPKMTLRDELPLDTPVRLDSGIYVERRADVFVIYNGSDQPSTLPLSKVGYLPPLAKQSPGRAAAAPLMRQMSASMYEYSEYLGSDNTRGESKCTFVKPNKYACTGQAESFFFDDKGRLVRDPNLGAATYRSNTSYKMAADAIHEAVSLPFLKTWTDICFKSPVRSYFDAKIVGPGAEVMKLYCVPMGQKGSGVKTTDLILGENGVVKTYATLMNEKETRDKMTDAMRKSQSLSDLVAMVPGLGSIEDAASCLRMDSSAVKSLSGPSGYTKTMAELAGWKPEAVTPQSVMGTAVSCLGAVPLAGVVSKGVKGASRLLGNSGVGAYVAQNSDTLGKLFNLFDASLLPGGFAKSAADIERLFPNNIQLAQLVKRVNDAVMRGNGMSSTLSGLKSLGI